MEWHSAVLFSFSETSPPISLGDCPFLCLSGSGRVAPILMQGYKHTPACPWWALS